MSKMSKWPWQKWVGRLLPFVLGAATLTWKLLSPDSNPNWEPNWWAPVGLLLTTIVQVVLAIFPIKTTLGKIGMIFVVPYRLAVAAFLARKGAR
jgi:hypothetical protein